MLLLAVLVAFLVLLLLINLDLDLTLIIVLCDHTVLLYFMSLAKLHGFTVAMLHKRCNIYNTAIDVN